jgi:hypothetical protein
MTVLCDLAQVRCPLVPEVRGNSQGSVSSDVDIFLGKGYFTSSGLLMRV